MVFNQLCCGSVIIIIAAISIYEQEESEIRSILVCRKNIFTLLSDTDNRLVSFLFSMKGNSSFNQDGNGYTTFRQKNWKGVK